MRRSWTRRQRLCACAVAAVVMAGFASGVPAVSGTAAATDPADPADAAGAAPVETISLGYATGKPVGQMPTAGARLSDDGRRVVFESANGEISPVSACRETSGCVFVHDRVTGVTSVASSLSDGTPVGDRASSLNPVLSGDGRWVAFVSTSRRYGPGVNQPAFTSLLMKNLDTGRMDVIPGPVVGPDNERLQVAVYGISRHGRFTVVTGAVPDFSTYGKSFVYDRRTRAWTPFGDPDNPTYVKTVSDTGRHAVGYNVNATGENRNYRIYQLLTGQSWPLVRPAGSIDAVAYGPEFSGDGRLLFVEWVDTATDVRYLVVHRTRDGKIIETIDDPNVSSIWGVDRTGRHLAVATTPGVFGSRYTQSAVYDRETGKVTVVSYSPSGRLGNAGSYPIDLSADARTVLFNTDASNIAPEGGDTPPDRTDYYYENDYFVATLPEVP